MARFILSLMELRVNAGVHLVFGFYVFSTAVATDISQAAAASVSFLLRRPPPPASGEGALVDIAAVVERDERRGATPVVGWGRRGEDASHRSILFYGNIIGLHFLWIGSQCSSIIWR